MSSEQDKVRELAERVARRLAGAQDDGGGRVGAGARGGELAALRETLSEVQRRLAHIESHIDHEERDDSTGVAPRARETSGGASAQQSSHQTPTRSTWLSGTYVPATSHPSQEQFGGIGEAVSELVDFFESEKTCNVEPGAKPCDHCGVCSSRGF